ncbi:polysaccharide deacetylase family protein [Streptomyces sp. NPDC016845]|uniref:polysaccharide deacetylase family protein n=1 Tax=Streptomyces sp. NPDC016845 TaxID=3364972 RepID=UPI00378E6C10
MAVLATAALATACASDPDDTGDPPPSAPAVAGDAARPALGQQARRAAAARRWGLARTPLTAPKPPTRKPVIRPRAGFEVDGQDRLALPPVFTTVPTTDKVVFLTIDDGAEKDPRFLRMMSDLQIPYSAFLTDTEVRKKKPGYAYFKKARSLGATLNNHTLHHRFLPDLSYAQQKHEICGMQDKLEDHYGKRPTLFRPPYGDYDQDTLRAAKACGIEHAPIWNAEVFADRIDHREWDRSLHPGDIVLTHFRGREDWAGTMPDMARTFLDRVTAEGYAVARLEDYL